MTREYITQVLFLLELPILIKLVSVVMEGIVSIVFTARGMRLFNQENKLGDDY